MLTQISNTVRTFNQIGEVIKLRLKATNKAYLARVSLLKSNTVQNRTKEKLYTIYLRPIATYGHNA